MRSALPWPILIDAAAVGIAFGQFGAKIFAPREWGGANSFNDILLEITRVAIALSVFAVGVELPRAYVARHWRSLAILLGPAMLFGWFVAAGLMYAIIPGLDFLEALVVAACVTPTDPILASSVRHHPPARAR